MALIAALTSWASQRSAAKAAKFNADASKATEKEKLEAESYNRARTMDLKTIERQDQEIEELKEDLADLKKELVEVRVDNQRLHQENLALRRRVTVLESERNETHHEHVHPEE